MEEPKKPFIGGVEVVAQTLVGILWIFFLTDNVSGIHDMWGRVSYQHVIGAIISSVSCFFILFWPWIVEHFVLPKLLWLTRIFLWMSPVLMCFSCDLKFG